MRNPLELRDELKDNFEDEKDPFGRIPPERKPEPEHALRDLRNPETISAPVGDQGKNQRKDVAKTEVLLSKSGDLDLKKTDGPTGYWGLRTSEATRVFQKRNGLKVDGQINPGGETIGKLADLAAGAIRALVSTPTADPGSDDTPVPDDPGQDDPEEPREPQVPDDPGQDDPEEPREPNRKPRRADKAALKSRIKNLLVNVENFENQIVRLEGEKHNAESALEAAADRFERLKAITPAEVVASVVGSAMTRGHIGIAIGAAQAGLLGMQLADALEEKTNLERSVQGLSFNITFLQEHLSATLAEIARLEAQLEQAE